MRYILPLLLGMLICSTTAALAIDLHTAKNQGLVGETPTGYIEAVASPDAEISALVTEINTKRRQHYKNIAQKNAIDLNSVETLAGEKALEKTPSGQWIKIGGAWRKK